MGHELFYALLAVGRLLGSVFFGDFSAHGPEHIREAPSRELGRFHRNCNRAPRNIFINQSNHLLGTKCLEVSAPGAPAALPFDRKDALQRGRGDPQPLGHGDVVFHGLGDGMAAHHQHMRTPKQIAAHVDAVLMLLGDRVVQNQGQIQRRADRGETRLIHGPSRASRRKRRCIRTLDRQLPAVPWDMRRRGICHPSHV